MERGSDKHSARLDDQLEKEVRGYMTAERPTRAEEWKETEPVGEDQVDPGVRTETADRQPGTPDGMTAETVELRSQLAAALPRTLFPTDESGLLGHLVDDNAPDRLRQLVRQLPSGRTYANIGEVAEVLGLGHEEHRF
jgi:hypothetical protein